jgi:hypothetical protein
MLLLESWPWQARQWSLAHLTRPTSLALALALVDKLQALDGSAKVALLHRTAPHQSGAVQAFLHSDALTRFICRRRLWIPHTRTNLQLSQLLILQACTASTSPGGSPLK